MTSNGQQFIILILISRAQLTNAVAQMSFLHESHLQSQHHPFLSGELSPFKSSQTYWGPYRFTLFYGNLCYMCLLPLSLNKQYISESYRPAHPQRQETAGAQKKVSCVRRKLFHNFITEYHSQAPSTTPDPQTLTPLTIHWALPRDAPVRGGPGGLEESLVTCSC